MVSAGLQDVGCGLSPVDDEVVPADVASHVRSQEESSVGDVEVGEKPVGEHGVLLHDAVDVVDGDGLAAAFGQSRESESCQRRGHELGRDHVDADVVLAELGGAGVHQSQQPGLRDGVAVGAHASSHGGHAAGDDDAAALLGLHEADRVLHCDDCGAQVDGDGRVVLVDANLVDGADAADYARVAVNHVEPILQLVRLAYGLLDVLLLAHVAFHVLCLRPQLLQQLLPERRLNVGDDHSCAVASEHSRCRRSDPARAPGYDGYLADQSVSTMFAFRLSERQEGWNLAF